MDFSQITPPTEAPRFTELSLGEIPMFNGPAQWRLLSRPQHLQQKFQHTISPGNGDLLVI